MNKRSFWNNLRMFLWLTLLTGVAYPLMITGISRILMPEQAGGSLIRQQGKIVGSLLVGQKFERANHFWGRPSAIDYQPLPSGASNLSPISGKLKIAVDKRKAIFAAEAKENNVSEIPADLLFSSASGIDPHITWEAAYFQAGRVAKERGLDEASLNQAIDQATERPLFGILGAPRVNVLKLNLQLEAMERVKAKDGK